MPSLPAEPHPTPGTPLSFLAEGGAMGALVRAHDWSRTSLGKADHWPQSLRTAVGLVLTSKFPMFLVWGPHLTLIYNDPYGEILGAKHPSALGSPFTDVWAEIWPDIGPIVERALAGEATYWENLPLIMNRKGFEEQTWFTFSYSPVRDESGTVAGMFCACTETTATMKAEVALRESEERFRLIADSAPVPMWVTKLDRTRSFVNRAYIDFLGISYEEAVNFDWRTIIHPDDKDRIVAESIAGEASLEPFVLEGRYRGTSGDWRWIRSESQPRWGPDGEHQGFIGVAHDITHLKVAEATLREVNETLEKRVAERTADLESALQTLQAEIAERLRAEEALRQAQKMDAVGQLTGGIAHDFNNLLTPIVGGLDMIASRIEDVRLKRIAETALESARRGAKLTGQLLAFSRIQRISMKPVPVNQVIANMKDFLQHSIGREIRIETDLHPDVDCALCDENQLENAILNLAINARDAMPGGGALTISTQPSRLEAAPDAAAGDYVCVTIADSGEGMPPEVLARAMEPFFSTKPMGKGTGLGLAQVYGIAHQSGGTVRIESEPGKGTKVHILLPRADAAAAEAAPNAPSSETTEPAPQRRAKVLVIDDDPVVRSFITDALEGLGHQVEEAESGEEGLEKLGDCDADMVLLDFAMPGMTGAEVAKRMREMDCNLPIVFVTGYAETEQLEAALGRDVAVLRKPFGLSDLQATLGEHLPR